MAKEVVTQRDISIRLACRVFSVSERCYRYEAKLNADNARIAERLLRLTDNNRSWGFGLCYLYLRLKPPRKPEPAGSREFQPTESLREENQIQ